MPPPAVAAAPMIPVSGPAGKKVFGVPCFFPPTTPISSAPPPLPNLISLSKVGWEQVHAVSRFILVYFPSFSDRISSFLPERTDLCLPFGPPSSRSPLANGILPATHFGCHWNFCSYSVSWSFLPRLPSFVLVFVFFLFLLSLSFISYPHHHVWSTCILAYCLLLHVPPCVCVCWCIVCTVYVLYVVFTD